ncbi:MAG: hypothetical protein SVY15_00925 [Halobacteriota archaeon]|nr:hypothetical protein [Halobacteriota archaeon]
MAKLRRPFQDETLFAPCLRHFYTRTTLGRPGDPNEEPIKYTQTLNERAHIDEKEEWTARVPAFGHLSKAIARGDLDEEVEAVKRLDEFMDATGVSDDFIKGTVSQGADVAVATAEAKLAEVGEGSAISMIDNMLTEDMEAEYGIFPPVIPIPQRMTAAAMSIIYGQSSDCVYYYLDVFTNEYLWTWFNHIEEGILKTGHGDLIHHAFYFPFSERRHLRTGEKLKHVTVQRPAAEGLAMVSDVLKDLRNEVSPEHSMDPLYIQSVTSGASSMDCQYSNRAFMEIIGFLYFWSGGSLLRGFPFQSYTTLYPVPGVFDLLLQLPLDMLGPRFIGLLAGTNLWLPRHTMTLLETNHEVFGQEMIPPTYDESLGAYFTYGMDTPRYPTSYKQSKHAYGQDALMREPTDYPTPEGRIMAVSTAEDQINDARKNHPDWLATR